MKTTALAVRIAALSMLLVLMSCGMPVGEQGTASKDSSSLLLRPRSTSDQFDFETISEVRFEVAVEWVDSGEAPTAKAIVELSRPDGSGLYTGATEVGLTHRFAVSIPLTDVDYRLNVVVPGVARERFDLPNLARSSTVRATARLRNNVVSIQSESDVKDSDGDGIVDTYDAFPDKSESAFQDQIPADGRFTVAFEDNFPNVGDADYNDFVAQYVIRVIRNPENEVLVLDGDIWARARAAGYDHEFGLVVQFPGLQGFLNANYSQADGATDFVRTHTTQAVSEEARITIFPSTKGAFVRSSGHVRPDNGYPNGPWSEGYVGSFRISGISSIDPGVPFDDWSLSVDHFDPYLLVHNTGYDVHLVGKPALEGSNNFEIPLDEWEGFRDPAGYPRALLVPTDWGHPSETLHIEEAYPRFRLWREKEGGKHEGKPTSNWYLFPEPGRVVHPPAP